jgi:hypothetical protein
MRRYDEVDVEELDQFSFVIFVRSETHKLPYFLFCVSFFYENEKINKKGGLTELMKCTKSNSAASLKIGKVQCKVLSEIKI